MGRAARLIEALQAKGAHGFAKTLRQNIAGRKRRVLEFGVRPYLLRPRVKHVFGPRNIDYDWDELLMISVVRNGELYIESFIDHYHAMGVKHFVFLDNGSTDRTVELLCTHDKVTVLQSHVSYNRRENTMKPISFRVTDGICAPTLTSCFAIRFRKD